MDWLECLISGRVPFKAQSMSIETQIHLLQLSIPKYMRRLAESPD
jgi:hypothetical protein